MADTGFVDRAKQSASNMASSVTKQTYPVPTIPNTPSRTINDMLHTRCGKVYDNPVKAGIAQYICLIFTVINKLYLLIHKDSMASHSMWMAACGVVGLGCILKVVIVYQIVIASAFLVHFVLYYSAIGVALFGCGLAVAGMVFFDKDSGSRASTGFTTESVTRATRTTYNAARSTVEGAQQYLPKDD